MIFFLTYLYVHYVIFLPKIMHMHTKLVNSFGNWLIKLYLFCKYLSACLSRTWIHDHHHHRYHLYCYS